eukprot:TRINITY_DN28125_c0_g3_i1.p1 TRINITY_DN28125_c0_g3~~TRINITY_DN28125_c0_g3_i1.p1  ORF type:complete len:818 (-),score=112.89 TRINITY_DN28125_c0_g3_i1:281-2671(-)
MASQISSVSVHGQAAALYRDCEAAGWLHVPSWFPSRPSALSYMLDGRRRTTEQAYEFFQVCGQSGSETKTDCYLRWLGWWIVPIVLPLLVCSLWLLLAQISVTSARLRSSRCCRCREAKVPPKHFGTTAHTACVVALAVTNFVCLLLVSLYLPLAAGSIGQADCYFFQTLSGLTFGRRYAVGDTTSWAGFGPIANSLTQFNSEVASASASTGALLDTPAASVPEEYSRHLANVVRVHARVVEGRLWQEHRCVFCEEADEFLSLYIRSLSGSLAASVSSAITGAEAAAADAQEAAASASMGLDLQIAHQFVSNLTFFMWREVGDPVRSASLWAGWAVAAFCIPMLIVTFVYSLFQAWLHRQPSVREALGATLNAAQKDVKVIVATKAVVPAAPKAAWLPDSGGGPQLESPLGLVDTRLHRISWRVWTILGLATIIAYAASGLALVASFLVREAGSLGTVDLLLKEANASSTAWTYGAYCALQTCSRSGRIEVGGAWSSSGMTQLGGLSAKAATTTSIDEGAFDDLASLASTDRRLHGRYFIHTDSTELLPEAVSVSTASREVPPASNNETLPGMFQYAAAVNKVTQGQPAWTFQSVAAPAAACAEATAMGYFCRIITTNEPSDVEAHRDYGGHASGELFRIARMKERVWLAPFGVPGDVGGNGTTLQPWLQAEFTELATKHDALARAAKDLGPGLLTLLESRWQETLQLQGSLKNVGDCTWVTDTVRRADDGIATAESALFVVALAVMTLAASLTVLTCSSYSLWWWSHRREDTHEADMAEAAELRSKVQDRSSLDL